MKLYTQAVEMVNVSREVVAMKPRRKVAVNPQRIALWRYAQQERDACRMARDAMDDAMCARYLDGQFMGYDSAMEAVKKAKDLGDHLAWLIARKHNDDILRQKCGLFVDWDYSAGYEAALTDIMERMEVTA